MKKKLLLGLVLSAVMAGEDEWMRCRKADTSDAEADTGGTGSFLQRKTKRKRHQSVNWKMEPTQQSSKLTAECFM